MLTIRRSEERGHFDHGWLDTRHTFSFADYFDPAHSGFRSLRVLNEDRVRPGAGFGAHPHRDMEIISLVLDGALRHGDDMGNGSVIRPGDVQKMSAGTGVVHSERNDSDTEPVHFLQIWIIPARRGIAPRYEQKRFPVEEQREPLLLVASADREDGVITLEQDVRLYRGILTGERNRATVSLSTDRHAWLQVTRGSVDVMGETLRSGDGAAISSVSSFDVESSGAEFFLFDLA